MTHERWQQMKLVYEQVDGVEPPHRLALLGRLCGDDRDLRSEVEKLLGDNDAGTFLKGIGRHGRQLVCARGRFVSDLVLIENANN